MFADPVGYMQQSMPGINNILNMVQQNGGNAQRLFYKLAEQKGVDPQSILQMFK